MKSRIHFASFSLWEEELSQSIHLTRQTHTLLLINCRQRQWLPDDLSKACNAIPFPTDHFLFATELDNQQTISPFFSKRVRQIFLSLLLSSFLSWFSVVTKNASLWWKSQSSCILRAFEDDEPFLRFEKHYCSSTVFSTVFWLSRLERKDSSWLWWWFGERVKLFWM